MGLFDRLSREVRANLNDMIEKAENPEVVLEQAITDMQENLVQLRQAVARAIVAQKRTEQQYNNSQSEADIWQQRAQLALDKGDENLAREALIRRKSCLDAVPALESQLEQQTAQVETLKRNLIALESKISEAKAKRSTLKARLGELRANEQLQSTIGRLGTSCAMGAFERMEEKVREMEARSQTLINPSNSENSEFETRLRNVERKLEAMKNHLLEQQRTTSLLISQNSEALGEVRSLLAEVRPQSLFDLTRSRLDEEIRFISVSDDTDDELAAMKAYLTEESASRQAQPNSDEEVSSLSGSEADDELEALRKQIDTL